MSSLVSAVTSLFGSKDDPPTERHVGSGDIEIDKEIAPDATAISRDPHFPAGVSTRTTLDYTPKPDSGAVTAAPAASVTGTTPMPVPAFQGKVPELRTSPTVFLTDSTASTEPSPLPLITVGPIIGLVTDSTARVLIECNRTMTVKLRLTMVERNVRTTRANAARHDNTARHNVDATTTRILSPPDDSAAPPSSNPQQRSSDLSLSSPPVVSSSTASSTGRSPALSASPMDAQEAAIRTGASSGSPVTGAAPSSSFPDSTHRGNDSQHSPGTTIGHAAGAAQPEHGRSTEPHSTPATQPSPSEQPQHKAEPGALNGVRDSTFAPKAPSPTAEEETRAGLFKSAFPPRVSQQLASPLSDGHVLEKDVECRQHRVSTVTFVELLPDCRYELTAVNIKSRVTSSFTTLLDGWPVSAVTPLNLAIVSCNLVSVTKDLALPESDLWLDLRRRVALHEIDLILHIGDQVYADEKRDLKDADKKPQLVFPTGVDMIKELPPSDWPACAEHIKELYRQLYRETWSHPPTAFVLANAPSLMIYDDHDFRDDFGNEACDSDPTSPEYYVGRCAHEVMCEYQRQLWDNVNFDHLTEIKKDFHMHVIGEHGVVFLDVRGPRSLHKVEDDKFPYMGSLQWKEVKDALGQDGIMRDVKSLLMVCPAPIVFLPTSINDMLGRTVIDDALGHWSSASFKAEQIMMLNLCQAWKAARPGRELTFIGGDVHVGGHSEVMRDGVVIFQQLVTSAISNYRLSKFEFFMGQLSQDLVTTLDDGWSFKHRGFTRQRNYGVVQVSADDLGPLVKRRLITPRGEKPEADNRIGTAHLK